MGSETQGFSGQVRVFQKIDGPTNTKYTGFVGSSGPRLFPQRQHRLNNRSGVFGI
jgi:hypothetical protein